MIARLTDNHFPSFNAEYRFHPRRLWKIDIAFVEYKVAVEIEGGTFGNRVHCRSCGALVTYAGANGRVVPLMMGGRHNFGAGFEKDTEKYNEVAIHGWLLVRLTAKLVRSKKGLDYIARALKARGWKGDWDEHET